MLKLVILDCDGVLFDSAQANIAFYNAVLERLRVPPLTEEWEQQVHFLASGQVYDAMFGPGSPLAADARRAAREISYTPFFDLMRPVPGLEQVLATLRTNYSLAMATNRGSTVPEILRRFGLHRYIDLAVGIHDVEHPKPHPDMLNRCLRHFGVRPRQAVYVGDAETDRQAASAAGTHFVGVGGGHGAAYRVRDLRDLPGELERLGELACQGGRASEESLP